MVGGLEALDTQDGLPFYYKGYCPSEGMPCVQIIGLCIVAFFTLMTDLLNVQRTK